MAAAAFFALHLLFLLLPLLLEQLVQIIDLTR